MVLSVRLVKYLANAGVASRRASEVIIASGRVKLDGVKVTDPARSVDESSDVTVDGKPVKLLQDTVTYIVNKPTGVFSTVKDPHARKTVIGLVPSDRRLYPVGRLDVDTGGLILVTDDGELAHRLMHPSFGVDKTYKVVVDGSVSKSALKTLREGVALEDGVTSPAKVEALTRGTVRITIHEGRNRQVRRMFEAVGCPIKSLTRTVYGTLELGKLASGEVRELSTEEVDGLRKLVDL